MGKVLTDAAYDVLAIVRGVARLDGEGRLLLKGVAHYDAVATGGGRDVVAALVALGMLRWSSLDGRAAVAITPEGKTALDLAGR